MSTKNAVLLIVKQNNGIDYNALLNKFASSYSNMNSARAALSRSLKDLIVFGFLSRRGNRFFVLEKGEAEIYSEIKNKLVIGLNSSLKQKQPENDIDSIVTKLQILLERSRQDKDLMKTSRSSIDFFVSDLENVQKNLEASAAHLSYISRVFSEQINSMKELDFYDLVSMENDKESSLILAKVFSEAAENEFAVECTLEAVAQAISENLGLKHKNNSFTLPKKKFKKFCAFVLTNKLEFLNEKIILFSSSFKLVFFLGKIFLSGPYSEIKKLK